MHPAGAQGMTRICSTGLQQPQLCGAHLGPWVQRDGDPGTIRPAQDFEAGRGLRLGKMRRNGPYRQGFSVGRWQTHGVVALFSGSGPTANGYKEQDSQCQTIFTVAAIKHMH